MKSPILILFILINSFNLFSQDSPVFRNYATQSMTQKLVDSIPEVALQMEQIEEYIKQVEGTIPAKKIIIPVVFHILFTGEKSSVSEQDVYNQLDVINQDFDREKEIKHPADIKEGFADKSSKMEISFCLPKKGADKEKDISPISFYSTDKKTWPVNNDMKSGEKGGVDPWDTQSYLNIWVVDLEGVWSGFAQMPGGPVPTDGIVIDADYFGVNRIKNPDLYQEGKTLTHLIGSYLGLKELWNSFEPCADDGVEDTPIHNAPNFTAPYYNHVSTCTGNPIEMSMNFMDNSVDEEIYMFTLGQKQRLLAMLSENGPRYKITQSKTNCEAIKLDENNLALDPFANQPDLDENNFIIFPNPVQDEFTLLIRPVGQQTLYGQIMVYSSLGKLMHTEKVEGSIFQKKLNCSQWAAGVYTIHAHVNDQSFSRTVVISSKN